MRTFITKDPKNFVELGVPTFEYAVTSVTLEIPTNLEFGKVYYRYNDGVLQAFKILAFAVEYTIKRKGITYLVQFPNGEVKWIYNFISACSDIYDSKEEFVSSAGSKHLRLFWHSIPYILKKHSNDMLVNDIWESVGGVVKNTFNYTINYMLFTKEGCSVCVSARSKYNSSNKNIKIFLSKEECIKDAYNGMMIEDFGETSIKIDIKVEVSKPITSKISIVEL